MKEEEYNEVVSFIKSCTRKNVKQKLCDRFPNISRDTLGSISSQEYQRKTRYIGNKYIDQHAIAFYYKSYNQAVKSREPFGFLVQLADKLDLSPSLLAKVILEKFLTELEGEIPSKSKVSQCMRNPSIIIDPRLGYEISRCNINDENYGPIADAIKHAIGHEYELKLKRAVISLGIPFKDENQLRNDCYDKTPDILLEIPIAVDGKVVNWIESKGSFGDHDNHEGYLKSQYWSYQNRYGPGIVIYWFGFIEELNIYCDKGITVIDHIPDRERITFLRV